MLTDGNESIEDDDADPIALLTVRETQVVAQLGSGRNRGEIARSLGLSELTVKTHLNHAFAKIGARNAAHAVYLYHKRERIAHQRALVELDGHLSIQLVEWQLRDSVLDGHDRPWYVLTGWLTSGLLEPTAKVKRLKLTRLLVPNRLTDIDKYVDISITREGDAYGFGLYMSMQWPRNGALRSTR